MELNDGEFKKKFNSKSRLNCADCGSKDFRITATPMPNVDISEAVMMHCKICGHSRFELM